MKVLALTLLLTTSAIAATRSLTVEKSSCESDLCEFEHTIRIVPRTNDLALDARFSEINKQCSLSFTVISEEATRLRKAMQGLKICRTPNTGYNEGESPLHMTNGIAFDVDGSIYHVNQVPYGLDKEVYLCGGAGEFYSTLKVLVSSRISPTCKVNYRHLFTVGPEL